MARTSAPHGRIIAEKCYKFIRKVGETASTEEENNLPNATQQEVAAARGSSWALVILFYATRTPGPTSIGIPVVLLLISAICRTVGIGAPAPIFSSARSVWVITRSVLEVMADSGGSIDGRFWAFAVSLLWPLYAVLRYAWGVAV